MSVLSSDIHSIAQRFLKDIESGKAPFYSGETPELLPSAQPAIERVVVAREEHPHYLAGIKPSGRPVWTHSMKFAMSYDATSERLAHVLNRLDHYQIEVDTMPACWFSNFQG